MDFAYSHFTGFSYLFRFDVDLGNATILHAQELAEGGSATKQVSPRRKSTVRNRLSVSSGVPKLYRSLCAFLCQQDKWHNKNGGEGSEP